MLPKRLTMDDVTRLVMQLAKRRGRFIPEGLARDITDLVVQTAITQAIETGRFKFRNGWGAFRLAVINTTDPIPRAMPDGQIRSPKARGLLRYDEGDIVRDLLGIERRPGDYKPTSGGVGRSHLIVKGGKLLPDA